MMTSRHLDLVVSEEYMSRDRPDDDIRTVDEFETALEALLADAVRNDVDLRGSWVCETDEGRDSWEVMIYELE